MEAVFHEFTVGPGSLRLETGEVAKQASGAVMVYYQGSTLLVTATVSPEPREGVDFFPLMVDFEERMYAAGRFPGGFFKREGRPSEEAILAGRRIDRTLRPVFPKQFRHDVQVIATTLSSDGQCKLDVLGIIGASAALGVSRIPFPKPVAAVRIARVGGELVVNPTLAEMSRASMNLLVSGTRDYINMIEDESAEVPEEVVLEALELGHSEIRHIITEIEAFTEKAGVPVKVEVPEAKQNEGLWAKVKELLTPHLERIIPSDNKTDLYAALTEAKRQVQNAIAEEMPDTDPLALSACVDEFVKQYSREHLLRTGTRVDGRQPGEIRMVSGRVGLLPRVHGSALFMRGQTQVLSSVTLGTFADRQRVDSLTEENEKRYVHHYNFPPYSVGEVRFMRSPGRREIGHGALAEHALLPVIPDEERFPYSIRVVSEVTESNASSSMASVCGSTLALMDAGVPIRRPVAGISVGLIYEADDNYVLLSDISGFEDFNGDMDFKVAGTSEGLTAIQMDVKIEGLTVPMIREALERARVGRMHILEQMQRVIALPRQELSPYAPTLMTLRIDPDQIGMVIGPAGKTIKRMELETGASIDIDEDGTVFVAGVDREGVRRAYETIRSMTMEIEEGMVFEGTVVSIVPFGAFIEVTPGRDGLLHISNVSDHRIERVEDVLQVGDRVRVKVRDVDSNGKVNLIRDDIEYKRPTTPRRSPGQGGEESRREGSRREPRRRDNGGRSSGNRPRRPPRGS